MRIFSVDDKKSQKKHERKKSGHEQHVRNQIRGVEVDKAEKELFIRHPVEQIAEHLLKRHRAQSESDGEESDDERVVIVE